MVLAIVIAVAIGLIIYILLGRTLTKSLPPPDRRGSIRLSKNRIIFNSAGSASVSKNCYISYFWGCVVRIIHIHM